jgi:hypothetical protein
MDVLHQFIVRTPVWVWVLFVYLVVRGLKARKAGETTLVKIAIIPILFTAWGLHDLIRIYGATMGRSVFGSPVYPLEPLAVG